MKRIIGFKIVDMGIQEGMETPREKLLEQMPQYYNGYAAGIGTDAESALDDVLHTLQEDDFDVTNLEWIIKNQWNPSREEGNGCDFWYHFGIVFKSI